MRALVIGKPQFQIPPAEAPSMAEEAIDWYERHRDSFQVFGTFPDGGGFAVVDFEDEDELNRMIEEMPFSPFNKITVHPFLEGDAGFRRFQEAMQAMSGAASS